MSSGCFGSSPPPPLPDSSVPKPDNTPVGQAIHPCPERNSVILLGGPGRYQPQDSQHDQYWGNYYKAAQHVFGVPGKNGFPASTSLKPGECVHWLVYERAYVERWASDKISTIQFVHEPTSDLRYQHGYTNSIKEYVAKLGANHKYVVIDSYKDLWETLNKLPDKSLTRLYYFGHGGPDAFYLRWEKDIERSAHPPAGTLPGTIYGRVTSFTQDETVNLSLMDNYKAWLTSKAKPEDGQISKFYACTSAKWARKWKEATSLKSEGSINKISFDKVGESTLSGVESDGGPMWTSY